ncbi:hypothetical protein DID88_004914 [Monilinia fructigena]|uniref:Uncharacterized protein n=1 Tax=Monilinia fructigena TaxID=38457 RepID=A0A395IRY0_9HELO|nr:hypothetical protein DID88_004914 [Monilinia fructigena]
MSERNSKKLLYQLQKKEPEEAVLENVTAINTYDDDYRTNPKSTKKSPSDGSFAIPPPRYGRNKGRQVTEETKTAEPLAHIEPVVEAPSRTTRGRGRASKTKKEEDVIHSEAPSHHAESDSSGEKDVEQLAEPLTINEQPLNSSLGSHKTRGRGRSTRATKAVVHEESASTSDEETSGQNVDNIGEVAQLSLHDEKCLQKPKSLQYTPEAAMETLPVGNKRRRNIPESSTESEGPQIKTADNESNKRRKLAPKPEGMGIPPVGTTQAARDERRKYMDRERQRRCRQRKKERQQGEQAAEREVVSQAKDERKKAMARERVRRHRENQRQKRGPEIEAKDGR